MKWTKEKTDFLRANYPAKGYRYCAEALNIDLGKVKSTVRRLNLMRSAYGITTEQKEIVTSKYKELCTSEIARISGLKLYQVYGILKRKGLKIADWTWFTPEEDQVIIDNRSTHSNGEHW